MDLGSSAGNVELRTGRRDGNALYALKSLGDDLSVDVSVHAR